MSHHHSRKSRKDLSWMDIAGVLLPVAQAIHRITEWSYRISHPMSHIEMQHAALNEQRLENLRLDAQAKTQRVNKLSNEVVMTDARAELDREKLQGQILSQKLKNLELQNKLEAAGVFTPTFKADNYTEPGDVRRGQMYEQ